MRARNAAANQLKKIPVVGVSIVLTSGLPNLQLSDCIHLLGSKLMAQSVQNVLINSSEH